MARKVLFSDKTVYVLISEVKKYPVLWNTDDLNYNNRYSTASAWRKITAALDLPEWSLRAKWKNLRDTYKKEIKKAKLQNIEDYKGKWQFFKMMSFVKVVFECDGDNNEEQDVVEFVVVDEFADQKYKQEVVTSEDENDENQSIEENEHHEDKKQEIITDSYDVFFLKSLVPYFKELNPMRKLIMRNRIQELLLNELAVQSDSKKRKRSVPS